MDILTMVFGFGAVCCVIFFIVNFLSYGDFDKTAAIWMCVFILCGVLTWTSYRGSKIEDVYVRYDATIINDNTFRVAKKECITYTLGTDECKTVGEELIYKKEVYFKFKGKE